MQYKAIIFDLDGTAIPNKPSGLPSDRVIKAVQSAKKHFIISAATGRPISMARGIFEKLSIDSPCVISGGTQIINPKTEETLWEKKLSEEQIKQIVNICKPYPYGIIVSDELSGKPAKDMVVKGPERVAYVMAAETLDGKKIADEINALANVTAHEVVSWTPNHVDIHITHSEATKKHAIEVLLKMLQIDRAEVIGIGDSNNDLPLFEMAGYKVDMGNATDKLKAEADEVILSVAENGLAEFIERILLKKQL